MSLHCVIRKAATNVYMYADIHKECKSSASFDFRFATGFSSNWQRKDQVCFSSWFLSLSTFVKAKTVSISRQMKNNKHGAKEVAVIFSQNMLIGTKLEID